MSREYRKEYSTEALACPGSDQILLRDFLKGLFAELGYPSMRIFLTPNFPSDNWSLVARWEED